MQFNKYIKYILLTIFFNSLFSASAKSQGLSILSDTFKVVNWNLEFFGDDPTQLPDEIYKTRTIMNQLKADAYALVEIVNKDSLQSLVKSLEGNYDFIISSFATSVSGYADPSWSKAQKLAFVFNKEKVKINSSRALLQYNSTAYYNWSSGRFPYLIDAMIKGADGNWLNLKFIVIHAKAMSDAGSCARRKAGAAQLKDSLDIKFTTDKFIILGDFNDDLDESICSNESVSNYYNFVVDSTNTNSYKSLTLPLSKMGLSSINGFTSFIDHVIVSNEVYPFYVSNSATLLKSEVNAWVSNYNSFVSDHFPVITKYIFTSSQNVEAITQTKISLFPNPVIDRLYISNEELFELDIHILSIEGNQILKTQSSSNQTSIDLSNFSSGCYFLIIKNRINNDILTRQPFIKY